jgi:hypothetical protein
VTRGEESSRMETNDREKTIENERERKKSKGYVEDNMPKQDKSQGKTQEEKGRQGEGQVEKTRGDETKRMQMGGVESNERKRKETR